jgi:hypothetical protein
MATKKVSSKTTASKSRTASASKATGAKAVSSKATAGAVINRKSLTVGVGKRSPLTDITRQLQRALGEAGCTRCLSGLERLILDARVNPR